MNLPESVECVLVIPENSISMTTGAGQRSCILFSALSRIGVNGGDKTGHGAAQNQASGGAPSAMARALAG